MIGPATALDDLTVAQIDTEVRPLSTALAATADAQAARILAPRVQLLQSARAVAVAASRRASGTSRGARPGDP